MFTMNDEYIWGGHLFTYYTTYNVYHMTYYIMSINGVIDITTTTIDEQIMSNRQVCVALHFIQWLYQVSVQTRHACDGVGF